MDWSHNWSNALLTNNTFCRTTFPLRCWHITLFGVDITLTHLKQIDFFWYSPKMTWSNTIWCYQISRTMEMRWGLLETRHTSGRRMPPQLLVKGDVTPLLGNDRGVEQIVIIEVRKHRKSWILRLCFHVGTKIRCRGFHLLWRQLPAYVWLMVISSWKKSWSWSRSYRRRM